MEDLCRVCGGFVKGVAKGLLRVCEGFVQGLRRVCEGFAKGFRRVPEVFNCMQSVHKGFATCL
jgi:hypothetical protein